MINLKHINKNKFLSTSLIGLLSAYGSSSQVWADEAGTKNEPTVLGNMIRDHGEIAESAKKHLTDKDLAQFGQACKNFEQCMKNISSDKNP